MMDDLITICETVGGDSDSVIAVMVEILTWNNR